MKCVKIDSFGFAEIKIGPKSYDSDVIVEGGKVISPWVRKNGHCLNIEDLKEIEGKDFEALVIGTGMDGFMEVDHDVVHKLEERGFECYIQKSRDAVETYNDLVDKGKKVALAIHITC